MGLSVSFFQIYSQPVPGYFGADQTLDFMLQAQTGDGNKKVKQVKAGRAVAAQEWGRLGKKRQTFSGPCFSHLFGHHSLECGHRHEREQHRPYLCKGALHTHSLISINA